MRVTRYILFPSLTTAGDCQHELIYPFAGHSAVGNELSICAGADARSELWCGADAGYSESAVLGGPAVPNVAVGIQAQEAAHKVVARGIRSEFCWS